MKPLEYEIDRLKEIFLEMAEMVRDQIALTKEALLTGDAEVAGEVMRKEGRVNAYELTIDRECEDFLALQSPVAVDLRLAIAILKMSGSLERVGDHAFRISSFIYDDELKLKKDLITLLQLPLLFDEIDEMLGLVLEAFEKGDAQIAKAVFKKDKHLDKINKKVPKLLEEYFENTKASFSNLILLTRVVGKIERAGDQIKNMAEETIFYLDSKVIKHKKKNKRIVKRFSLKNLGPE
ncbi:MAG: phosphate signaling complex protein PhoU [Bacteroidales bacterium]|nr:phosphate signaling complex protein PhoU [Bacteroidales bacterium]